MQKNTGLKRISLAGVYAFKGLVAAARHEAAFRQELVLALGFIPLAFILELEQTERVILIMCTVLVLIAELLNSAVEAVVDRIGSEFHELSGRAKDIGSAAVLVSLVLWLYAWGDIVIWGMWLGKTQ